jgi:hypothetical protein
LRTSVRLRGECWNNRDELIEDSLTENASRTRDDVVARLRRAGELQVSGDNQVELDSYFDTRQFRFHGPDDLETDYAVREFTQSPAGVLAPNGQRVVWDRRSERHSPPPK